MQTAFRVASRGPEAGTSVLLRQGELRKPRAGAQQELKEKETEDLKQQERMFPALLWSVTHLGGEARGCHKQDISLSVNDALW